MNPAKSRAASLERIIQRPARIRERCVGCIAIAVPIAGNAQMAPLRRRVDTPPTVNSLPRSQDGRCEVPALAGNGHLTPADPRR